MRVYFDNAATTPISQEVIKAMLTSMNELYGNPTSIHSDGRKVRAAIENARKLVAQCLGASIGEIFFTSCGTESNNMVIKCAVRDLGVERIITSPIEHPCILRTVERVEKENGVDVEYVEVNGKGQVQIPHLKQLLADSNKKTLVSLMHANNEIGTMLDIDVVSSICQSHNAFFHSDTVQTIGHFPIDVSKTPIHFLAGSAHKFHGPKGVGFVYIRNESSLHPFIDGGSQERNMRAGTENVYGIIGLSEALKLAVDHMEERRAQIESLRNRMISQLKAHFRDIQFNGDCDGDSLYKVLSVSFPPHQNAEMLLLKLDIEGVSASGGSACSSGAENLSHVIKALNIDSTRKTIRFSFSHYNTIDEVDFTIEKLKKMVPVALHAVT